MQTSHIRNNFFEKQITFYKFQKYISKMYVEKKSYIII
jgi:hypothetical protein